LVGRSHSVVARLKNVAVDRKNASDFLPKILSAQTTVDFGQLIFAVEPASTSAPSLRVDPEEAAAVQASVGIKSSKSKSEYHKRIQMGIIRNAMRTVAKKDSLREEEIWEGQIQSEVQDHCCNSSLGINIRAKISELE
jgi:hypothetical protein